MVKIVIPIEPVEQARPRYTSRGRFVRVYDPPKVSQFKKDLGYWMQDYMTKRNIRRFETPLTVTFTFYRKLQKSLSKVERERRLQGVHPPTVKPDLSNYLKSTEDALNEILWKDDAQIVEEHIVKKYAEEPRIELEIKEWSN